MPVSLTIEQKRFLKSVRESGLLLSELMGAQKLEPKLLMRWLRRHYFRQALHEARVDVRRRMLLEIDLLSQAALATLSAMQSGKIDKDHKTIYFCRMVRDDWFRLRARLKRSRAKHRIQEPEELVHPAARDQEDEILARMEARRRGQKSDEKEGA
jgi:hypothetical protein